MILLVPESWQYVRVTDLNDLTEPAGGRTTCHETAVPKEAPRWCHEHQDRLARACIRRNPATCLVLLETVRGSARPRRPNTYATNLLQSNPDGSLPPLR